MSTCVFCLRSVTPESARRGRSKCTGAEVWACHLCAEDQRSIKANAPLRLDRLERSWVRSCTGGTDDSGVPLTVFPKFDYARFANAEWRRRVHPKLLNLVESYDGKTPLLILGGTGVGKTSVIVARQHAELERLRRQAEAGVDCRISFAYVTGPDLAGCRRRSRIGDEAPLFEHAARAGLCILDELGFEPPAPDGEIVALIDYRHRLGVPTIVVSGLTRDAFSTKYGGAVLRRLTEGGAFCNLHPSQKGQARAAG
jgi:hypothetical protein